jgi:uncharacterized protein (TIGR02722 family)
MVYIEKNREKNMRGLVRHIGSINSLLVAGLLLLSCSSGPKVTRLAQDKVTDLSGGWNDSDSRQVSQKMVADMLGRPWLKEWTEEKGKKPVVVVGRIRNETMEHISTRALIADIERELVNSGRIAFTTGGSDRDQVRLERVDQLQNAAEETIKDMGREVGADFMLFGTLTSFVDQAGGKRAVTWQVDLYLVDIEKNTKVWVGQERIKKLVERSKVRL